MAAASVAFRQSLFSPTRGKMEGCNKRKTHKNTSFFVSESEGRKKNPPNSHHLELEEAVVSFSDAPKPLAGANCLSTAESGRLQQGRDRVLSLRKWSACCIQENPPQSSKRRSEPYGFFFRFYDNHYCPKNPSSGPPWQGCRPSDCRNRSASGLGFYRR